MIGGIHQRFYALQKERHQCTNSRTFVYTLKIWIDSTGQDLIEYALMAGFVAVAAGAIMPGVATSISQIFSQVTSVLSNANNGS